MEHLLQDFCGLRLAVGIVEVGLVDCLEEKMDFLWGFGAVGVENAENEAFDDVTKMALHRGAFLKEGAFHIIVDVVLYCVLVG